VHLPSIRESGAALARKLAGPRSAAAADAVRTKAAHVRLVLACLVGVAILFGLAFAIGALSGWQYGSRTRVCAVVKQGSVAVPVCDYDYRPPRSFPVH
jgi:hypothetical protein